MKFIKLNDVIIEMTGAVIRKQDTDKFCLLVENRFMCNRSTWTTREERDAEFDRLEKILITEAITDDSTLPVLQCREWAAGNACL